VAGEDLQPLANGRYKLEEPLGMGGMATVYRAMDGALQVERAIKILSKELVTHQKLRTRFITEARTMARLRHPNVVTVYDVSIDEARPFIVMEMIEGGSLADLIQLRGRLAVKRACELMIGALKGVQAAHDQGVVHRDLKPDNILLTLEGVPKVTDFGIAHVEDLGMALTRTGTVMGTLAYMSPEQRTSARDADARSDVFAMGATLYVAVTGKEPFDIFATNVQDELLGGIPVEVGDIIRKACQYRADDRFASATEMAEALSAVSETLPDGLTVETVRGIDAGSHDSKETISLGDLSEEDVSDTRAIFVPSQPSEGPPQTVSEPSFLVDSPTVPEPPAQSNRMVILILALGVGLGLAGGSIWLLKSLNDQDSSSETSKQDASVEEEEPPDEGSAEPQVEETQEGLADELPGQELKSPVEDPEGVGSIDIMERNDIVATRNSKKDDKRKRADESEKQEEVLAIQQSAEAEVIATQAESEPELQAVELEAALVAEPVESVSAVVGGTIHVNATPQNGNVLLNGSFAGTVPLSNYAVSTKNVTVKIVSDSGETRQVSVSFDGGETRRVHCYFESSKACAVR
jgi:serine/threonine protein kinase